MEDQIGIYSDNNPIIDWTDEPFEFKDGEE